MEHDLDTVAIIGGTGALGSALAAQLTRSGVTVRLGSRKARSADAAVAGIKELLGDDQAPLTGHVNEEAAQGCPIVFLTVPYAAQVENLKVLKSALAPGQILVDATVPLATALGGKPTRTIGVWQGSAAQQAQELAPGGVVVVSALHSISAPVLSDLENTHQQDTLVMSDDRAARARVAKLIERIPGLRAVDGGPLEASHVAEQITALLIGLNIRYKTHAGVRFTNLPDREWS